MLIDPKSIRHYRLCAPPSGKKTRPRASWKPPAPADCRIPLPGRGKRRCSTGWRAVPSRNFGSLYTPGKSCCRPGATEAFPWFFPPRKAASSFPPSSPGRGRSPGSIPAGITAALDFLGMPLDALLPLVRKAAAALDNQVVKSKESLDRMLAKSSGGIYRRKRRRCGTRLPSMAARIGKRWAARLSLFCCAPAPFIRWSYSASGRRTALPLPPSETGRGMSRSGGQRRKRRWSGNFCTVTAPPPGPPS